MRCRQSEEGIYRENEEGVGSSKLHYLQVEWGG